MAFTFKHGDRPLPGYEIRRGVGRGGFGEVYYAVSDGGREVAIKYLHSNADVELRGVRQCMNLKSPHLVTIFDVVGTAAGEAFIVMEYIHGPSLRDLLATQPGGLGVARATFFLQEIAKGLAQLHASGVVHRDLKPGNIFYDEGYVKIGDYGLSKSVAQSSAGHHTTAVGTMAYMAPEVGSGRYSCSIDIYALGIILYEMLLGRVPFEGQSPGEVLMKHLLNQPEVDALPAPFGEVIRKALAKAPQERYQNVEDLIRDVLGAETVQRSMACFDALSLTQVAARAAETLACPRPSPAGAPGTPRSAGSSNQLPAALLETPRPPAGSADGDSPVRVRFAGFWIRALALLIDWLVLSPLLPLFPFNSLLKLVYGVLLLAFWNGQTVGKRICRIRVIDENGGHPDLAQAAIRELSKILSVLTLGIGYVMAGMTRYKQALHDMVASTYVVYAVADEPLPMARRQPDAFQGRGRLSRQAHIAPPRDRAPAARQDIEV
jgi:uncharacterized RDD family membrane protein YckC